ncbi:KPN_02809 family neutral zinc metallopeptidase [Chelatococcus reniformis]|uniref:Membrane protein n=1 Tax=Chelatococcus reniformis TaxID=1494448 RepID=A0A916U8L7_9HYPH|nr:neutral zinc metallopeptidase [Chelatococcus reniformis]GGC62630.1 membrane protein [Chelatococcus reniformis]
MRWDEFRTSSNVEDRRGDEGYGGGGGGLIPGGRGGLGIGTIIILGLIGWALGIDPRLLIGGAEILSGGGGGPSYQQQAPSQTSSAPPQDQVGKFAASILGNTEDVWKAVLPAQANVQYREPRMVLFSGATRSACGAAQSAMGPFYCPLDQTVYVDLSFFEEMRQRFRAGGDFAYAYVLAHEVGHHVQNLLGVLDKVEDAKQSASKAGRNALSVRVELMADCLAGVWANNSNQKYKFLEEGDVENAMNAASAIGDDRLQKQSQGFAIPDSFTHGSSAQRTRWFMTGLKSGQVKSCDTFRAGDQL